jgi:predicted lipid-binding transport protein (Tim44 family)
MPSTSRRANWRIVLALLFSASLALAPALAQARAGSSFRSAPSSMGSRGVRSFEHNGAQPLSRSMAPVPQRSYSGYGSSPGYGGSFFGRHPFLTGLAGGFIGSWLFGHAGYAAGGMGGGYSTLGFLVELLIIGFLIWLAFRLIRGRAFSPGGFGGGGGFLPQSAGAAAPAPYRGDDIAVGDGDLDAFQRIHAAVQTAWGAGDLARLRQLMTPEMLSYFSEELTRNASQGVQNAVSGVELLKGELTESWEEDDLQYATADMRWRALDYTVTLGRSPGDLDAVVAGNPRVPIEAEEVWTFVRRRGGNWLLSAIQQV